VEHLVGLEHLCHRNGAFLDLVPQTPGQIKDHFPGDPRKDLVGQRVGHDGLPEDHEEVVVGPFDGHAFVHKDDLIHTVVCAGLRTEDVGKKLDGLDVPPSPPHVGNGDGPETLLPGFPDRALIFPSEQVHCGRGWIGREFVCPFRHAPGNLTVHIGDLSRGQVVFPNQAVVDVLQDRRIVIDSEGCQPSLHSGQVPFPAKHLPPVDGRDFINAVPEQEPPVIHRDKGFFFWDVLAVEVDNAHGVRSLGLS